MKVGDIVEIISLNHSFEKTQADRLKYLLNKRYVIKEIFNSNKTFILDIDSYFFSINDLKLIDNEIPIK